MNIVYALSGEGRGHSSLAKAILPVLEGAGHRVKLMTYGRSLVRLRGYETIEIRGIRHCYDQAGRLSLLRSLAGNAGIFPYYWSNWKRLRRQLQDFAPDLFIVNFEPLAPFLARSLGVPVVSFDNQHALIFIEQPVPPGFRLSALVTQTAARIVAARSDAYVVMSFFGLGSGPGNVHVVPPAIQGEFRGLRPENGPDVLVYLKEANPRLLEVLRQIDQRFVVYGYDTDRGEGNLTFRSYSDALPREMAAAKAVIGTSGLSLISEALWLRKPFFGVPLKGEFEQTANALFIRESNLGDFSEHPTRGNVTGFLGRLDGYRASLDQFRFDPDAAGRALLELADGRLARSSGRRESGRFPPKPRPQIAA